ncbi:centrosomal protein of 104 kDa-like [Sinocyclocheilus grahami]|uniref:centrosomal protein of 104 kDa-like n=1 Tax=Sinocyclocheilus grahami TaxID=75366 RepID=UPI0007AD2838|nr:PREDICTED: centrosomal protein of 104 kDa-like [Sinocyclocheilus grahami]
MAGQNSRASHMKRTTKPRCVKKVNQSVPADAKGSQPSVTNYLDNLCIFCGERDESFTEDGLDLHYWKHCPMLQRCLQCRQVVEIASLTEHLLTECERRADFTQCPLCSEALTRDKLTEHAQSAACNPPTSGGNCNHCPLCHENFASGEEFSVARHTDELMTVTDAGKVFTQEHFTSQL